MNPASPSSNANIVKMPFAGLPETAPDARSCTIKQFEAKQLPIATQVQLLSR
ncbi:MAG: hypothetical protein HC849_00600 [Oscillatoriales cyanobacterium RU_3_3]|nr:hypothetical protein [Oscillatoriales cyanobacterium RU_3_3]